jgi:hypothetical protein
LLYDHPGLSTISLITVLISGDVTSTSTVKSGIFHATDAVVNALATKLA